jgi:hypothetical protein
MKHDITVGVIDMKSENYHKYLVVCLAVIIIGCLLPWGCWGDLVSICENGIDINFVNGFRLDNWGGILVLLLSLLAIGSSRFDLKTWINSKHLSLVCAIILFGYTLWNFGYWIMRGMKESGIIGAASPAIGSVLVLLGSIAQLFLINSQYRNK